MCTTQHHPFSHVLSASLSLYLFLSHPHSPSFALWRARLHRPLPPPANRQAPRRARAKSTTSSPKAQVIPPRGQFSEQSAAAVALASIVGDGGELAPRSAPAKRGTSASTGGAPLRAVGVGARVPSAPALKNAHARERLFDDQFNAQLLSPGAGFRSPTSPVPLPPPGIPQPRRPTAATLDSEIAALAGAVDRQRSGSAASASASAMSNRHAVR